MCSLTFEPAVLRDQHPINFAPIASAVSSAGKGLGWHYSGYAGVFAKPDTLWNGGDSHRTVVQNS